MRLITRKYIISSYTQHSIAKTSLQAFVAEVENADWSKPSDVIESFPSADVITGKRFVFNIKGNTYRLIADIEFKKKLFFVVWFGTHAEYDKIDASTIAHAKNY
ncbi:type II toxin-antitoxin system HigB family toxin [Spirosoma gilvum]